ncbi:hypothetical protein I4X03_008580 [Massilia sp. R798]|uniref:Uncharacterized protein n=1 Tax=Massilia soli TaxID=2792854 RepID=A0ABS7SQ53_9BURK|nr:hypothetical protein [Massilia soli]
MANLRQYCSTLAGLIRLPVAPLRFNTSLEPTHVPQVYAQFTRRHPRYKIIRSKTMGAALIDVGDLNTREKYLDEIKGKNNGAYHAARARKRGYVCKEIDRNAYVDDIHDINISQGSRQGRPMDKAYTEKRERFEVLSNFQYYGVLNRDGKLVAYATFGIYGNFGAFSQLIGHRNNDGIMHLLIVDVVCRQIGDGKLQYIMYDTYFGAQAGLRQFKTILGFRPYRAKYSLQ